MHVKAKKMAVSGMMLALSVICMILGSVIESNTLFLLAAASFFVGIVIREFGIRAGCAFLAAGILLGLILSPNKFYVATYAAMGLYILFSEFTWGQIGRMAGTRTDAADIHKYQILFWILKYSLFNVMYLPAVFLLQQLLFGKQLSAGILFGVILAGQAMLFLYDRAYGYVQGYLWNRMRGKFFK